MISKLALAAADQDLNWYQSPREKSQGYGGRISPPCRQQRHKPSCISSRAHNSRLQVQLAPRPVSRFLPWLLNEDCRELANASPQFNKQGLGAFSALRFLIISEVSATSGRVCSLIGNQSNGALVKDLG